MKTFKGQVVSNKMDKTAVVEVTRHWMHPLYKKTIKQTKKYLVHDQDNKAEIGDEVTFAETKPISKRKRFIIKDIQTNN